ncbi:MAG: hypothetical protein WCJ56_10700 [bacterium]
MDYDSNTVFSYHDAMILYCIQSRRKGVSISVILGFQDMVDRTYSEWEDLDLALRRLIAIDLIAINNGRFLPTPLLLNWKKREMEKTHYIYDGVKQLETQLNAYSAKVVLDSIPLPKQILNESSYDHALTQYLQSHKRSTRIFIGGIILVGIAIVVMISIYLFK